MRAWIPIFYGLFASFWIVWGDFFMRRCIWKLEDKAAVREAERILKASTCSCEEERREAND